MNELKYNILGSSSDGNCLIFNDYLMIDIGLSYKKIKPYLKNIKIVLLTHMHSDHFNKATIKKVAYEKPNIMWVCGNWLVEDLVKLGVNKKKIYVIENQNTYDFGAFTIKPIYTYHDVENTSYLVNFKPITMYYATDTYKLNYLPCLKNLNYYFLENNYSKEEIEKRIEEKTLNGEYVYETRVINSHLSAEECNSFLIEMMGDNSKYVYLHQHKERKVD